MKLWGWGITLSGFTFKNPATQVLFTVELHSSISSEIAFSLASQCFTGTAFGWCSNRYWDFSRCSLPVILFGVDLYFFFSCFNQLLGTVSLCFISSPYSWVVFHLECVSFFFLLWDLLSGTVGQPVLLSFFFGKEMLMMLSQMKKRINFEGDTQVNLIGWMRLLFGPCPVLWLNFCCSGHRSSCRCFLVDSVIVSLVNLMKPLSVIFHRNKLVVIGKFYWCILLFTWRNAKRILWFYLGNFFIDFSVFHA